MVTEPAYASAGPIRTDRRAAERRRSAAALLTAVTGGFMAMRDSTLARERFEEQLRTMVRARSLTICDEPAGPPPPQAMGFEIPSMWTHHRSRLEVVFDPARTLDAWTCQLLEVATHIAALLLEIERAHGRGTSMRPLLPVMTARWLVSPAIPQ